MPKINRRTRGDVPYQTPAEPSVRGALAPDVSGSTETGESTSAEPLTVKEIIRESHEVDMFYMCRAYSEENRPGFHANEDRFFCEEHVRSKNSELIDMFIVGVLDGHDGAVAADMVADQLPALVFNQCFLDQRKVHEAHVGGFEEIEKTLAKTGSTAGCCANSCVVWGKYLWCANLGDCRAVWIPLNNADSATFDTGAFCWMSRDLKASAPYEVERIRSCGWRVSDGRVEGLEPTRTIGDFDVKAKVPKGVISIVPETRMVDMVAEARKKDKDATDVQGLLVQATDGIWDCVNGQDILNVIKTKQKSVRQLQKYLATAGKDFDPEHQVAAVLERIAGDVVTLALTKGSSDDCTVILTCVSVQPRSVEGK
ncbi:unnamed protein product [Amoebophrya sp. A120]|nr:unnamed protein product [Amoebophrya sp. A120]|eukprot:GSA120T00022646001.1